MSKRKEKKWRNTVKDLAFIYTFHLVAARSTLNISVLFCVRWVSVVCTTVQLASWAENLEAAIRGSRKIVVLEWDSWCLQFNIKEKRTGKRKKIVFLCVFFLFSMCVRNVLLFSCNFIFCVVYLSENQTQIVTIKPATTNTCTNCLFCCLFFFYFIFFRLLLLFIYTPLSTVFINYLYLFISALLPAPNSE